jgi:hypothetical protein
MKHLLLFMFLSLTCFPTFSQMIMSAEGVKPDNACNPNSVYFLMERKARPVESIDSIEIKLNKKITFANDNPDFAGNCAIQFVVNCHGQVGGGFHMVTKSGNDKLDSDLIEFFKTIENWKAGRKNKKKTVDSWYMWRLEIKNGLIDILNK